MLLPWEWIQSPLGSARGSAQKGSAPYMHALSGQTHNEVNGRIQREQENVSMMRCRRAWRCFQDFRLECGLPREKKWSPAEIEPHGLEMAAPAQPTSACSHQHFAFAVAQHLTLAISYLPLQNNHNPSPLNALFLLSDFVITVSVISITE